MCSILLYDQTTLDFKNHRVVVFNLIYQQNASYDFKTNQVIVFNSYLNNSNWLMSNGGNYHIDPYNSNKTFPSFIYKDLRIYFYTNL